MAAGSQPRTVAIVAGEPSGDLLGSLLVAAVRHRDSNVRFVGVAGPRMEVAGVESLYSTDRLAVRGYVEVMRHYFDIVGIRRELRSRWLAHPPDMFIGVDAPDFNFDLERDLRRAGVTTVHFVSPSIWAWRPERMAKIREAVSHMISLFPFEAPLYEEAGVPVTYVGHPLADMLPQHPDRMLAREQLRLPADRTIIALLPGSRESELKQLADLYVATARAIAERRPDVLFLVPLVNRATRSLFEEAMSRVQMAVPNVHLLFGHSHEAMMAANAALVASGTATLEAALLGCPMVITYRMPALSWRIMWPKRRLPYVGLPNILAGEFVVPELLQAHATPENISQALLNLVADSQVQRRMELRFAKMRADLRRNAADGAAQVVLRLLSRGA